MKSFVRKMLAQMPGFNYLKPKVIRDLSNKKDYSAALKLIQAYVAAISEPPAALLRMVDYYAIESRPEQVTLKSFDLRVELINFLDGATRLNVESEVGHKPAAKNAGKELIFVYWAQGFDKAPPIVQACINQLRKVTKKHKLIELTDENIGEWLDVPPIVVARTKSHKAHFSDILRVGLLAKHGGTWIDATVWTDSDPIAQIADIRAKSGFFLFRNSKVRISSWFLSSNPGNRIPELLYEILCEYWLKNDRLVGYFMFHELFECLYFADSSFAKVLDETPFVDARKAHLLRGFLLFKKFDPDKMTEFFAESAIQKLTYKIGNRALEEDSTFEFLSKPFEVTK